MPIFNGKTEELMKAVPVPYNIRLARRKFLQLISKGIDIQYGKKLREVSTDGKLATAIFQDGSTATGKLLVGAEGAHSVVRDFLLGPEEAKLEMSPLVASTAMAKLPADAAKKFKEYDSRSMVIFHPAGYCNWIGVHDAHGDSQPGDWTFMMVSSWVPSESDFSRSAIEGSSEKILSDLKKRAQIFGEGFNFMWQSIPDNTKCWHSRLSYWIPRPWNNHNGTVTLVGDAAHPMTFHRGQGLNNAIHDVVLLSQKTKQHGFTSAAISAYEEEMLPRAKDAVIGSNQNSVAIHDWDTLLQSPLFTTGVKQK